MAQASLVGARTQIRGNVRGTGTIEVAGRVEGDLATDGDVRVAEGGEVLGDVTGTSIQIDGTVAGAVRGSDAVLLGPTARVVGDLRAPRVGIAEGARYRGTVETEGAGAAAAAGESASRQRPAPSRAEARAPQREVPRAVQRPALARKEEARKEEAPRQATRTATREGTEREASASPRDAATEPQAARPARPEPSTATKTAPRSEARERPAAPPRPAPRPAGPGGQRPSRPQAAATGASTGQGLAASSASRQVPSTQRLASPLPATTARGRQPPPPVVPALARGTRGRKKKVGVR